VKADNTIANLLSARILELVAETIEDIPDGDDLEPVFKGMASAYAAFALHVGGQDFAREMLGFAVDRLNDPEFLPGIIHRTGHA
jgi:hypothetical protein